ncbi:phytanoyl-CoA dioxygenase family protein [Roseococcus sp.]|uniref:phytanoyl-CoA dioxygenase family protein n=1 Tax=Roseococcus sp. TaxID=2109646 RepID=UPI003BA91E94
MALRPGFVDAVGRAELAAAIEACRRAPGPGFRILSPPGRPLVISDRDRAADVAAIGRLARAGTGLAAGAFGSTSAVLLEDQWFLSEAGAGTPSPWHQDQPFLPVEPFFVTIWIPLDPPPGRDSLRAIPGSQRGPLYAPADFSSDAPEPGGDWESGRTAPMFAPALSPGDAVLIDSRVLHATGGFCPAPFRRISLRYAPPDARLSPRPWPVAERWRLLAGAAGGPLPLSLPRIAAD